MKSAPSLTLIPLNCRLSSAVTDKELHHFQFFARCLRSDPVQPPFATNRVQMTVSTKR